ncbi:hypothetical protein FRB90_004934 [Tulasnella sp. 427]|nr:hypothetical protein FRB90_004934 [Tulasnella sp. 427]
MQTDPPRESPAPSTVADSPSRPVKPSPARKPRSKSISRPVTPPPPKSPEEIALDQLKALVKSCPPKSFHEAILSRLDGASPEQVSSLTTLLEGLAPPPTLHCARCHQDYLEEENYDRVCVMDHDDNTSDVRSGHETFWGCCGASTNNQEPPPGWCFEGKHTSDRAKARYREDFEDDEEQDGLQSCEERKCHRRNGTKKQFREVHVVITRRRSERQPPPAKKKRLS